MLIDLFFDEKNHNRGSVFFPPLLQFVALNVGVPSPLAAPLGQGIVVSMEDTVWTGLAALHFSPRLLLLQEDTSGCGVVSLPSSCEDKTRHST